MSNAKHLKMSEDVGMVNISHFAEIDVEGPDAADLLEYICVAKVGGDTAVGKGTYSHFLDAKGGVRADLTVLRLGQDHFRVVDGADAGHRDLTWIRRMAQDRGANVTVLDITTQYGCLGVWGPNARTTIQKIADEPEAWTQENFPFAALRNLKIKGVPVLAFRISYVGMEKSLRLQNATAAVRQRMRGSAGSLAGGHGGPGTCHSGAGWSRAGEPGSGLIFPTEICTICA